MKPKKLDSEEFIELVITILRHLDGLTFAEADHALRSASAAMAASTTFDASNETFQEIIRRSIMNAAAGKVFTQ
ncbi:MAG: hypothetical protein RIB59_05520 [Rhodospirillales bacterium]